MEPQETPVTALWQGRRYYPISQYFRQRFGKRIAKVSVSVADQCPNRRPDTRLEQCIFCDEWASAAYPREAHRELVEQINHNKTLVSRRYKECDYLVYFQAYTNTLDRIEDLEARYRTALAQPGVRGLVIGTRPDCLPQRVINLLGELAREHYIMVELGLQSFNDNHLNYLKRGHTRAQNIAGIHKLAEATRADIGVHLIFGLPGETSEGLIETAQLINELPVDNVKLHNLHVLENTELAVFYRNGEFQPDSLETYADKVILFLRHLSPEISIQRLAGLASRWDELVAPAWTAQKMQPIEFIERRMKAQGTCQGDLR
ncbi:MAG: TIGR01212 family radical SAM protein [Marinobacter sp.]|uniref:TIGR01212 family radical SAM protein n=1 Tax=Marinobacter sp. TaxID=50741 RepID=UPI00396E0857